MTEPAHVAPGQIWADNDPRAEGRTLRVESVDATHAVCTVLTPAPGAQPTVVGTTTRIRLDRFRPVSTGYRLVVEGDEVR